MPSSNYVNIYSKIAVYLYILIKNLTRPTLLMYIICNIIKKIQKFTVNLYILNRTIASYMPSSNYVNIYSKIAVYLYILRCISLHTSLYIFTYFAVYLYIVNCIKKSLESAELIVFEHNFTRIRVFLYAQNIRSKEYSRREHFTKNNPFFDGVAYV